MGAGTQPPPPIHSSQAPPSTPRIKRNLVRRLVEQFNEEARLRDRDGQSEHTIPVVRAPYVIESNSRNAHKHLHAYNYGKKDTANHNRIRHHPEVNLSRTPPAKPHRQRKTKAVGPEDAPINGRVMYHRLERADENHVNEDDRRHRATPTYFFGQRMQNSDSLHRSSLASNSSGGSLGEGESSLLSAKLVRRADKRVTAHAWGRSHSPDPGYRVSTPTIIPIRLEHNNNNNNNGKANGAGHYTPPVRTTPPIRVQIDPPSPPATPTSDGEGRDFVDGELIERARGLTVDRRKSRSRSFGGADGEPRRVYFSAHPPKVPSTGNGEVITHAAAIADIPPPPNQRVSRTVQRSFSMLSPWAPRKPKSRPSPPSQNSSSAAYSTSSSRSHSPAPVNSSTLNGNGLSSASENDTTITTTLNRKPKSKEKVKVRRRHSMPKGFLFLRKKRPQ